MEFALDAEHRLLQDTVNSAFRRDDAAGGARSAWTNGTTASSRSWNVLHELGVLELLAGPATDTPGDDLSAIVAIEQLGRWAVPGPVVEHMLVAVPILSELAPRAFDELQGLNLVATATDGPLLPYGSDSDLALVFAPNQIGLYDLRETADRDPLPSIDGTRRLSGLPGTEPETLSTGDPAVALWSLASSRASAGVAAMLLGLSSAMVEQTVRYVSVRKQFGVPVGSFQAVKHQLADAHLGVEFARHAVYAAAWELGEALPTASRSASLAKYLANTAARRAARVALQCHGAIGFTMEADLHLYLTRVWALTRAWGSTEFHADRIATAIFRA